MTIATEIPFEFFQVVYLVTDVEQKPRIIIGLLVRERGNILIELQSGTSQSWHFIEEITTEKIYA